MSGKVEINDRIKIMASIVTSKPNNYDKELIKNFEKNIITKLEDKIMETFINNDTIWIEKEILSLDENCDSDIYQEANYKNLFSFYGVLYLQPKYKNKILFKITKFMDDDLKNINKLVLYFLIHSKINLKNMEITEKIFISKCVKNFYDSKNIKFAINFENVFKSLLNLQIIRPNNIMEYA